MAKPKREGLPALSEAQLEIMHLVWGSGEVTVTDVWNVLAQHRQVTRNTVLTLMERLEKKGWLKARVDGQTHYYTAAAPRRDHAGPPRPPPGGSRVRRLGRSPGSGPARRPRRLRRGSPADSSAHRQRYGQEEKAVKTLAGWYPGDGVVFAGLEILGMITVLVASAGPQLPRAGQLPSQAASG